MSRVNLEETIRRVDFPESVWEWLDFYGEIVGLCQQEALYQDSIFVADTQFKQLLVRAINKDLSTLNSIYILLRCEMIHQASSHVRLLCESLITLKYISLDKKTRAKSFLDYSDIEAYEIANSILEWEQEKADPVYVQRLLDVKDNLAEKYNVALKHYTFTDKKGRNKKYYNWCNKGISSQASDCGSEFVRLYELVYSQMSSYIHGSAWSLRRQMAYSRNHYQADVILNDIAAMIRTTIVVWVEWAKFCVENMDWRLSPILSDISQRLDILERKHFSK
jgi:hypothetical protein